MNDKLEQLKTAGERIHLDPAKKDAMRKTLVSFIAAHDAIAVRPARFNYLQRFLVPAGAFAMLLIAGGGTSLAAEKALPGDPLYAMKVKVNEPIIAAFQTSSDAKAEWHTQVALRRLEEADSLAIQGKLTPETKTELGNNFENSARVAAGSIAALNETGKTESAADISANFESSLKAHAEILAKVDAPEATSTAPAMAATAAPLKAAAPVAPSIAKEDNDDPLVTKIRSVITTLVKERGDAEVKVADKSDGPKASAAARNRIDLATKTIAAINNFLMSDASALSSDSIAAAQARLQAAIALKAQAETKFSEGQFGDSFRLAGRAVRVAQETRVLASAQLEAQNEDQTVAESSLPAKAALNLLSTKNPQDSSDEGGIIGGVVSESASSTETASTTSGVVVSPKSETSAPEQSSILNVDGSTKTESP